MKKKQKTKKQVSFSKPNALNSSISPQMLWFLDESRFWSSFPGCQGPNTIPIVTDGTPDFSQQMLGSLAQHFLGVSMLTQ